MRLCTKAEDLIPLLKQVGEEAARGGGGAGAGAEAAGAASVAFGRAGQHAPPSPLLLPLHLLLGFH